MKPKEQASYLIDKYLIHIGYGQRFDEEHRLETAKQCALVCVDEILKNVISIPTIADYYLKVKDELNT